MNNSSLSRLNFEETFLIFKDTIDSVCYIWEPFVYVGDVVGLQLVGIGLEALHWIVENRQQFDGIEIDNLLVASPMIQDMNQRHSIGVFPV